jgi:hypothetical protein
MDDLECLHTKDENLTKNQSPVEICFEVIEEINTRRIEKTCGDYNL